MTWFKVGPAGIPASLKTDMDAVLNKKFGTSTTYAPNTWPENVNLLGPLPEKTASGSVAHITDGADTVPVKSWLVTLPASLSGYSAIGCTKSGKNLLNDSLRGFAGGNIYFGHDNGSTSDFSVWLKAGTYTISVVTADGTATNIYIKDSDTNTNLTGFPAYSKLSKTFTLANDTNCAVFVYKSGYTSVSDITSCQIEVGSTATSYEPYTAPTTATASLGRTIYGGTADVVNGTGTDAYTIITVGNSGWTYYSSGGNSYLYRTFDDKVTPQIGDTEHELICDVLPYGGVNYASQFQDLHIYQAANKNIYIKDVSCQSANDYYQKYSAMKIGYELASPSTFTFTPITPTPETPLGVSNWWADEGDSAVTYRADIDLLLNP